jgi:type IV secretory pathway TrbF-like protein
MAPPEWQGSLSVTVFDHLDLIIAKVDRIDRSTATAEANARLIAAAPDMYEALMDYVDGCHACAGDPVIVRPDLYPSTHICTECAPARAIIAKINGGRS